MMFGMTWHHYLPSIIFIVTFLTSILSGMAGGGGGFVITPFLIAIGLTPQQSIATGKLGALGLDTGAIVAFRARIWQNRAFSLLLVLMAAVVGIISSRAIRHLGNANLQLTMGVLNLAMIPMLFIRHHSLQSRRRHFIFQAFGLVAVAIVMLLQGIFSSGVGSLINVFLIVFFGMSALQANMMKRKASLVLDVVVLAGLVGSGFINMGYGLIIMVAGAAGGYLGSKLAMHEGERFARYALMAFMLLSGIYLITSR